MMATKNAINSNIPIEVSKGGTGVAATTAYTVQCGGTTSTSPVQSIASVGTSGQLFVSGGSAALPTFQTVTTAKLFQSLTSDPATPSMGQVWYNSTTDLYKGGQVAAGTWTAKNSMNTARQYVAGAGTIADALSFGGNAAGEKATTERWDGTNWTAKTSMNTARSQLGGAGTAEAALSFGGTTGAHSAVTELYSGTGNTWTAKTSLNTSRRLIGGGGNDAADALSYGGYDTGTLGTVERYTGGGTDTWTAKTALNTAYYGIAGTGTDGGDILACGGIGPVTTVQRYDGVGNSWTNKAGMNTAQQDAAGSGSADFGLIFGGNQSSFSAVSQSYNGVGDSWTTTTAMNTGRYGLAGSRAGTSTSALSFGGQQSGPANSAVTELYDGIAVVTFTVT